MVRPSGLFSPVPAVLNMWVIPLHRTYRAHGDRSKFEFESIASTDIVSAPYDFLEADTPTILWFRLLRSRELPESLKTVELAEQVVHNLHQISIPVLLKANWQRCRY